MAAINEKMKNPKIHHDDPTLSEGATLNPSIENLSLDSDSKLIQVEINPIGIQFLMVGPVSVADPGLQLAPHVDG